MRKLFKLLENYTEKEEYPVTITFGDPEDANQAREFFEGLQRFINSGCSRTIGIADPSDQEEESLRLDLDGDGHTRIISVH